MARGLRRYIRYCGGVTSEEVGAERLLGATVLSSGRHEASLADVNCVSVSREQRRPTPFPATRVATCSDHFRRGRARVNASQTLCSVRSHQLVQTFRREMQQQDWSRSDPSPKSESHTLRQSSAASALEHAVAIDHHDTSLVFTVVATAATCPNMQRIIKVIAARYFLLRASRHAPDFQYM